MRTKRTERPGCLARGAVLRRSEETTAGNKASGSAVRKDRSRSLLTRMRSCTLVRATTARSRSARATEDRDAPRKQGCSGRAERMSGLIERCQEHFGTADLYEALGIAKTALPGEVKKAYHKLSLKVHPDRVRAGDKEISTKKFQTLSRVYCILSDKEKRAVYDETGDVGDESSVSENRDWDEYWRLLFHKVSVKDIDDFEKKYKGSADEIDDLKEAYVDAEGDMGQIIDAVLCAKEDDEERFRTILDKLIRENALPKFKNYSHENGKKRMERKKKASREAAEAEQEAKRLGLSAEGGLQALIQRNQASRKERMDSLLSAMEARYSTTAEGGEDVCADDAEPHAGCSSKRSASASKAKGRSTRKRT